MDLYGVKPDLGRHWQQRELVDNAGPTFDFYWESYREAPSDQWFAQAAAQVIRGNSLLRSRPEVNPDRIGTIGVSWGGVLVCMLAGIDDRFAFAIAVYGCGGLDGTDGTFGQAFARMPEEQRQWVDREYDGIRHLNHAAMPVCFLTGTNDEHFPPDAWQRSRDAAGEKSLGCMLLRLPHGHQGAIHPMAAAFADDALGRGTPLPRWEQVEADGKAKTINGSFTSPIPVRQIQLLYTCDRGAHATRRWDTRELPFDGRSVSAPLPDGVTGGILNLTDRDGRTVSSRYLEF